MCIHKSDPRSAGYLNIDNDNLAGHSFDKPFT